MRDQPRIATPNAGGAAYAAGGMHTVYRKGGRGDKVRPKKKKLKFVDNPSFDSFTTSLPMVAASRLLDICGFSDMIDERTDWDEAQWKINPGDGAKAIVISTFMGGRRPVLSGVAEKFNDAPFEALFDSTSKPEDLNRHALANILDRIYAAGPSDMFRSFADSVRTAFDITPRYIHSDTTTVSVEGEYRCCEEGTAEEPAAKEGPPAVMITHGYSKDLRPDLKQYVLGYAVDDNGLLMEAHMLDGNSSDVEWNRKCIESMADTMRSLGLVYVADSKLADAQLLKKLMSGGDLFLTRCPANFGNRMEASVLTEVPISGMKAMENISAVKNAAERRIWETSREAEGLTLRAIAVKSSAMDGKGENAVQKDREKAEGILKDFVTGYECEADARKAFARLEKRLSKTIFGASAEFVPCIVEERPRGRPKKDGTDILRRKVWDVTVILDMNEEKAELLRRSSEMYVLISNVPSEEEDPVNGMSAEDLVRLYSGQWRVEGMFKTAKTPALADGLFIKTPERAEALLFLINTAVLLRGLMQLLFRKGIAELKDWELPRYGHWNGPLQRNVTAEYFIQHNQGCPIAVNSSAGTYRFVDEKAEGTQMAVFFMGLLGIGRGEFFG